jgi:hypothetical protein
MTTPPPPWSLHWGRDGELSWSDRYDLILRLMAHEPGIAGALPMQPKPLPATFGRIRFKRMPSCSHP